MVLGLELSLPDGSGVAEVGEGVWVPVGSGSGSGSGVWVGSGSGCVVCDGLGVGSGSGVGVGVRVLDGFGLGDVPLGSGLGETVWVGDAVGNAVASSGESTGPGSGTRKLAFATPATEPSSWSVTVMARAWPARASSTLLSMTSWAR